MASQVVSRLLSGEEDLTGSLGFGGDPEQGQWLLPHLVSGKSGKEFQPSVRKRVFG